MHLKRLTRIGYAILISQAMSSGLVWAQAKREPEPIEGTPFKRKVVADRTGRTITYYMGSPKKATAPIMLMIQGAGSTSVLTVRPGGASSSVVNLTAYAAEGIWRQNSAR